jgi:pyrimidine operon attenuation protein / uracil phosphoribosyltransferase
MNSKTILDTADIEAAIQKIALQIAQIHPQGENVYLVGIQRGGVLLANRIETLLKSIWGKPVPVGQLDISMHRDDLDARSAPPVYPTNIPGDITGKNVVLVDDVIFRGRTSRAALDALNDFGRPKRIQIAVLIDRGHLELPILANFVGKTIDTQINDLVEVRWKEEGAEEEVVLKTA